MAFVQRNNIQTIVPIMMSICLFWNSVPLVYAKADDNNIGLIKAEQKTQDVSTDLINNLRDSIDNANLSSTYIDSDIWEPIPDNTSSVRTLQPAVVDMIIEDNGTNLLEVPRVICEGELIYDDNISSSISDNTNQNMTSDIQTDTNIDTFDEIIPNPTYTSGIYDKTNYALYNNGVTNGPSGYETYYDLDMSGIVTMMHNKGYSEEDGWKYWVREDGVKMFGNYVMVAANLQLRPRGTIVPTSVGEGIVCDTGDFAKHNTYQLDIATNWETEN